MLNKLLPKEEKYFEDFRDMITHIQQMAELTHNLFSSEEPDKDLLLQIKPLENRCDEISNRIIKRLNKTFITPFDREDIFNLIKKLDDISDMLLAASRRVEIFDIKRRIKYADRLAAIAHQQIKELGIAINDLKTKHSNECKAVMDLESEGDKIYQQAIKELFEKEKDAVTLIKRKEILSLLEGACDKCQAAANVVLYIFIKNN